MTEAEGADTGDLSRFDSDEAMKAALLAAIVESSEDAIISKDLNGVVTSWNAAAVRIFGFTPEEMIGQPILRLIPPERHSEETTILRRIRAGERVEHFETVRMRKDGSHFPISVTVSPVRAPDGRIIGASKIARDVSERVALEESQRILSREVNHRSKNLLAVVQSIIRYTVSHSAPQDFVRRISERLQALSANQDLLIESSWRGADMTHIINRQLSHVDSIPADRIGLVGDALFLVPTAAQALGIAVHELATNAVKFGALSDDSGRVAISWLVEGTMDEPVLLISWRESGGPAVSAPEYAGFGSTIIERITGQSLGGHVTTKYDPTGLTWELRAPAATLIAAAKL